jgi:hypothetical protein
MPDKLNKRNSIIHVVEGAAFTVGISLCSFSVIIPSYIKTYTNNAFLLALIPVIADMGLSLPQTVSVFLQKNSRRKKTPIADYFWPALITRLCFIAIGVSIFLFAGNKGLALASFYLFFAVFTLTWGMAAPYWINLLSVTIPDSSRPDFLGIREFLSRGLGIAASVTVPVMLSLAVFPDNYAWLFLASGIVMTLGILPARFYKLVYPMKGPSPEHISGGYMRFLRNCFQMVSRNKKLLGLLVIYWGLSVSRISSAFYTPQIMDHIISRYPAGMLHFLISILNLSFLVFMALTSIAVGKLIRILGHKSTLIIGTASLFSANVIIIFFSSLAAAVLGEFFLALFTSCAYLTAVNAVMDHTPPESRSMVSSFNNTINALFIIAFSLIGSLIASIFSYKWALLFTAVLSLVILIYIFKAKVRNIAAKIMK